MQARISQLDLLRGIALLGIPFMNMVNFSMPIAAYLNPKAYLANGPLNDFLFVFFHLFADQKFMGLFAMLFGAGIILLSEKREQAGKSAAKAHYSRNFWLLLIGFAHATFIWEGDVLMIYAFIALFVYLLRGLSGKVQIVLGLATLLLASHLQTLSGADLAVMSKEELASSAALFSPTAEQAAHDIAVYSKGFWELVAYRSGAGEEAPAFQSKGFFIAYAMAIVCKATAMMLLGMGLFKTGILSGTANKQTYIKLAVFGLSTGLTLTAIGLIYNYSSQWDMVRYFTYGGLFNMVGSAFTSVGYIGLGCLWFGMARGGWIKHKIQQVGRMAFTNYLAQSVICVLIFYGFGLSLYGDVNRLEVAGVCVLLGLVQLTYSDLWLRVFRMGPLEWVWRTLTYFRFPPLLKEKPQPTTQADA